MRSEASVHAGQATVDFPPLSGARLKAPPSEEVGLLHDAQELLLVHLTVAVAVGLVDHLLELLVRHALSQLLSNTLQVLERDLAGLVSVVTTATTTASARRPRAITSIPLPWVFGHKFV